MKRWKRSSRLVRNRMTMQYEASRRSPGIATAIPSHRLPVGARVKVTSRLSCLSKLVTPPEQAADSSSLHGDRSVKKVVDGDRAFTISRCAIQSAC